MIDDIDLGLIDAYLDDALSPEEVERFDSRLSREPELASALHAARSQRAVRGAAWQSVRPTEAAADWLARRIVGEVRSRQRARIWGRWTRVAGAAAACLLFGFVAGWMGRGRADVPSGAHVVPVSQVQSVAHNSGVSVDASGVYRVALTDDSGNVVAVQKFTKYEDARQFANDLAVYQARKREAENGRTMFTSGEF
jgi:anti-sigma factor RsiW